MRANRYCGILILSAILFLSGYVLADNKNRSICELHKVKLINGQTQIVYGKPSMEVWEPYLEAESKLFPNAKVYKLGGCIISDESPHVINNQICPKCRKAEAEWRKTNKFR
jgi:hypothetical protein